MRAPYLVLHRDPPNRRNSNVPTSDTTCVALFPWDYCRVTGPDFSAISDEAVPALGVLLSAQAEPFLGAVIGPQGGSIRSSRIDQIRYTPKCSVVVRYRLDVTWADGRSTRESVVAAAGIKMPAEIPVLAADGIEIGTWTYPNDPFLPGLPVAANTDSARQLLSQLGVTSQSARVRLRAYRPARRAVVEVNTPHARVFIKVVRPSEAADLQRKHKALAGAVPVPHSLGWNEELGLVALQAMPGKPLRKALETGTRRTPEANQFVSLLDSFPAPATTAVRVPGPHERAAFHATLLRAVVPSLTDRIDAIEQAASLVTTDDAVAVHGDFHSSQILIRGSEVAGLIDVDTHGIGARSNDLAVLLAHISTAGLSTGARRRLDRYGAMLIKTFDQLVDPVALRRQVATSVLAFATGPFRVHRPRWVDQTERRVALAEQWAASANLL